MVLSRQAAEFAAEIRLHDWSDSPYRADRAGHQRSMDEERPTVKQLNADETDCVKLNVMWVAAQVLSYSDPNFDAHEFAEACGVSHGFIYTNRGSKSGVITAGLRSDQGGFHRPGTYTSALPEPSNAPNGTASS